MICYDLRADRNKLSLTHGIKIKDKVIKNKTKKTSKRKQKHVQEA